MIDLSFSYQVLVDGGLGWVVERYLPYRGNLVANARKRYKREFKDVHLLIVDKVSMVSYQLLVFVDRRLMEIKGMEDVSEHTSCRRFQAASPRS